MISSPPGEATSKTCYLGWLARLASLSLRSSRSSCHGERSCNVGDLFVVVVFITYFDFVGTRETIKAPGIKLFLSFHMEAHAHEKTLSRTSKRQRSR